MKKYYNIFLTLVIAFITGLSLTACNEGDDLNTDQYGNDIALNTFGPCPVLRGGTLYFYGSNLDQITEVDIPGADPITALKVITPGAHSEISIQVPAEKCDTGLVSLITAKGGKLKTFTPITYREDITFDKFYVGQEGTLTGNVGDIATSKGDYLNLMHGVIFTEKDTVKENAFLAHDRYTIQVPIPAGARTGILKLTDLAKTPTEIETKEALTINLPTVTEISPTSLKAGNTITITGTSLDQIANIILKGAAVSASNFLSQNTTTITFALPDKATDGEITLVTKSGVNISAGSITTVVPTELAVDPGAVKNGNTITITGKDLDLVTGITFPNATGATLKTASTTKLTADVPEIAQEGNITLSLANGKSVTVTYKLVKPTVTSCTPSSIVAGNSVIINGTDLDLVNSITFPGDTKQTVSEFTARNATGIAVIVPTACAGSGFILNLKNGTTVNVSSSLTIQAATDPAVSESTYSGIIGNTITVTGKNFNNAESVYIGNYKVTKFTERTNTSMTFQIPTTAEAGTYDFIFKGPDGTSYTVGKFTVLPLETTLWSGSVGPTNWTGDKTVPITDDMKSHIAAGKTLGFELECSTSETNWQIEIVTNWWTDLPSLTALNGGNRPILSVDPTNPKLEFTLAQTDIDLLYNQGNVFLFVGNGVYVKRIYIK